MESMPSYIVDLIRFQTFWSAVGTIAAVIAAIATVIALRIIFLARQQLDFDAWLKIQEIWTNTEFTQARRRLFTRLDNPAKLWTSEEKQEALSTCAKMNEFSHLVVLFLDKRKMLELWDDPVGKAWLILKPLVQEERELVGWPMKWMGFEDLGEQALTKLIREGRDPSERHTTNKPQQGTTSSA